MGRTCTAGTLLACLALPSCIQLQYQRSRFGPPLTKQDTSGLLPGVSSLDQCLNQLGAPQLVREQPTGAVLAWGWSDTSEWGFAVSWAFSDLAPSASLSFDSGDEQVSGLALFFDRDWRLLRIKRGQLRSVLPSGPRRPQPFANDPGEEPAEKSGARDDR